MAVVFSGINGPFVGRIGPVVGYMWKRKNCMRAYVEHIRYPNTREQQRERDWFVSMVRFASNAREALKLGFYHKANSVNMTEGNYFVMTNKRYFERVDGQINVDYAQLLIAQGPAADVYFRQPRFEENETVVVDFEKNGMQLRASGEDKVYLYAYAPGLGSGFLSAPVARRSKTLKIRLPEMWAGQEVHLYGFVVDRDGRPSNSTYVGVGRVNHYEDRGRYIPVNKNWKDFVEIANEANGDKESAVVAEALPEDAGMPRIDLFGDPPEVP